MAVEYVQNLLLGITRCSIISSVACCALILFSLKSLVIFFSVFNQFQLQDLLVLFLVIPACVGLSIFNIIPTNCLLQSTV